MMMAFLSSGTLIGILVYKKVILKKEIFYLDRPRNIFWGTFGLTVLIMGTVFLMSIYVSKLTSIVYFSKSSNKEMTIEALSRSEKMISKAISFDKNEAYYRSLSQVYLQEIGVTLRNKDINPEFLKLDLQRLVLLAKDNAEWAINQNPKNYVNYLNLGNVYSSLSTLMVKDSYQNSILAFDKARELAPRNPLILLARAQLELFNKNNDKAKDFAEQALEMKKDYREAQIFLSQITNNAPSN
jgi:tetratricopeptide (TPR) repeat protein